MLTEAPPHLLFWKERLLKVVAVQVSFCVTFLSPVLMQVFGENAITLDALERAVQVS